MDSSTIFVKIRLIPQGLHHMEQHIINALAGILHNLYLAKNYRRQSLIMHDDFFNNFTPVHLVKSFFEEYVVYDAEGYCWTWSF
jgi:hypothetical protein